MSIKANPFNHADLRDSLMIEWEWNRVLRGLSPAIEKQS